MSSMPKHQQNCKIERSNRAEYQLAPSEKLNQKRTQKESSRNLYVSQVFDTPKGNHQINCFFYRWQIAKVTVVTLSKTMKAKTFGSWVASSFAEILFQNCLTEQVWLCFDFRIEKKTKKRLLAFSSLKIAGHFFVTLKEIPLFLLDLSPTQVMQGRGGGMKLIRVKDGTSDILYLVPLSFMAEMRRQWVVPKKLHRFGACEANVVESGGFDKAWDDEVLSWTKGARPKNPPKSMGRCWFASAVFGNFNPLLLPEQIRCSKLRCIIGILWRF